MHGHCVALEAKSNDDGEQPTGGSGETDDSTDDGDNCDAHNASDKSNLLNQRGQQVRRAELPPRHSGRSTLDPETERLARIMHGCRATSGNVRVGDGWSSDEYASDGTTMLSDAHPDEDMNDETMLNSAKRDA